jgi:hypothetical protein
MAVLPTMCSSLEPEPRNIDAALGLRFKPGAQTVSNLSLNFALKKAFS